VSATDYFISSPSAQSPRAVESATIYAGDNLLSAPTHLGSRRIALSLIGDERIQLGRMRPLSSWETESITLPPEHGKVIAYLVQPASTTDATLAVSPDFSLEEPATPDPATPFREHAALASHALGLGKSQVARILGVSRVTLYDWLSGKREPKEGDNPERLRALGGLAAEVCTATQRPIYHRFVEHPLPGQAASILDLLMQPEWDLPRIRNLLHEARRLTTERDQHIAANSPPAKMSDSKRHGIFIDNMIAFGLS